jgi:hypothetical protein
MLNHRRLETKKKEEEEEEEEERKNLPDVYLLL